MAILIQSFNVASRADQERGSGCERLLVYLAAARASACFLTQEVAVVRASLVR